MPVYSATWARRGHRVGTPGGSRGVPGGPLRAVETGPEGAAVYRVLICDETRLIRDGLRTLLDAEPDIEVVDTTDSGVEAMMTVRAQRPDVVVTGLGLRSLSGVELIRRLRKEDLDPEPRIVVFTTDESDAMLADVLHAGASGLLTRDASREELATAVRAVAQGQAMLTPRITQVLLGWFREREVQPERLLQPLVKGLTQRERQVLVLAARGMSTEEMAAELAIGVTTIRTHVYRLRCKLQVKDRAQLVSFAYRSGLMHSTLVRSVLN